MNYRMSSFSRFSRWAVRASAFLSAALLLSFTLGSKAFAAGDADIQLPTPPANDMFNIFGLSMSRQH